jgi:hypothetical protein
MSETITTKQKKYNPIIPPPLPPQPQPQQQQDSLINQATIAPTAILVDDGNNIITTTTTTSNQQNNNTRKIPGVIIGPRTGGSPIIAVMSSQGIYYDRTAIRVICALCGSDIITSIEKKNGSATYICACILCLGGCIPCCLIPFCTDFSKDVYHTCPACNENVGSKILF